jgi:hypothetical protein
LLRRFGTGPGIENITGDLMEEYRQGRSVGWFWRQVLVAIFIGFGKKTSGHILRAVVAIVLGWSVLVFLNVLLGSPPFVGNYGWNLLNLVVPPSWWIQHRFYSHTINRCLAAACSGWIVAWFHRPRQRTMTVIFLGSFLLWQLPGLFALSINALDSPRYVPYLIGELEAISQTAVSIFLGNLLAGRGVEKKPCAM